MLRLTPEHLVAMYECLRVLPPFAGWKLPPADVIKFRVTMREDVRGEYLESDTPCLTVSAALNGHLDNILQTLAHEMIHLVQHHSGTSSKSNHNADFKRRAKLVCRSFGWDEKAF